MRMKEEVNEDKERGGRRGRERKRSAGGGGGWVRERKVKKF